MVLSRMLFVGLAICFGTLWSTDVVNIGDQPVTFEFIGSDEIPESFSLVYEPRRKVIQIKSTDLIQSLIIDKMGEYPKDYLVYGSRMVILPQSELGSGEHVCHVKIKGRSEPLDFVIKIQ